jgi:hypothetical protein
MNKKCSFMMFEWPAFQNNEDENDNDCIFLCNTHEIVVTNSKALRVINKHAVHTFYTLQNLCQLTRIENGIDKAKKDARRDETP